MPNKAVYNITTLLHYFAAHSNTVINKIQWTQYGNFFFFSVEKCDRLPKLQ